MTKHRKSSPRHIPSQPEKIDWLAEHINNRKSKEDPRIKFKRNLARLNDLIHSIQADFKNIGTLRDIIGKESEEDRSKGIIRMASRHLSKHEGITACLYMLTHDADKVLGKEGEEKINEFILTLFHEENKSVFYPNDLQRIEKLHSELEKQLSQPLKGVQHDFGQTREEPNQRQGKKEQV